MVQPSPNIQLMGESWSTLGSCPGGLDISTGPLFCGPKISFLQAKKDSSDQPTSYSFAGGSGRAVSALASPQNSQCGGCGLPLKTCTCKSILYTCFLWGVCVCVCVYSSCGMLRIHCGFEKELDLVWVPDPHKYTYA